MALRLFPRLVRASAAAMGAHGAVTSRAVLGSVRPGVLGCVSGMRMGNFSCSPFVRSFSTNDKDPLSWVNAGAGPSEDGLEDIGSGGLHATGGLGNRVGGGGVSFRELDEVDDETSDDEEFDSELDTLSDLHEENVTVRPSGSVLKKVRKSDQEEIDEELQHFIEKNMDETEALAAASKAGGEREVRPTFQQSTEARLNPSRVFFPGENYTPADLNPFSGTGVTSRRWQVSRPAKYLKSSGRNCPIRAMGLTEIDYKNVRLLSRFVSECGQILPRRITGVQMKSQRQLAQAIKRARHAGLMPFTARPELPRIQNSDEREKFLTRAQEKAKLQNASFLQANSKKYAGKKHEGAETVAPA